MGTARQAVYRSIYEHLLVLLDHTYRDVVKMRYDMLWNLLTVVTSEKCRRLEILPHFNEVVEQTYRCGSCDNCVPTLDFPHIRVAPTGGESVREFELELEKILEEDQFDLGKLRQLCREFRKYPTAKYRQARSILEGAPNNLCALFVASEFSPANEREGNTRRLLRTANNRPLSVTEIRDLYLTSPLDLRSVFLISLNESGTACDSCEGGSSYWTRRQIGNLTVARKSDKCESAWSCSR